MAYITVSNSFRILKNINFDKIDLNGSVYKIPIYFLSYYEINRLLGIKELLKNPSDFISECYIEVENIDTLSYVYEGGTSAYHSKANCKILNSNYINFEIPELIKEKGKEEIFRFREWFKKNKYLLKDPEKFVFRLQMAFGVIMNTNSIDYGNSGISEKENLNLEELEKRIDNIISEAGQYFKNANEEKKEILKKYQKYTYLAYSKKRLKNNDSRFSDDTIKNFLKQYDNHFKKPIIDLLKEYYRVLYNPELKFDGDLLEQLGFRPCGCCH
jgi:hypothetical protein